MKRVAAGVRKQAIEKMPLREQPSRIAHEDPKPEIREKAGKRLEEIGA